jgi:uncharacterized membrane protein
MATVNETIEVNAPIETVYNQWTQFEEFPKFMEGVESVTQLDDTRLHWVAEIAGKRHEWDATITDQKPESVIAWMATDGKENGGRIIFQDLGDGRTRVDVEMKYETEGLVENLGSKLGADDRRVKSDLERFKELVERRGAETGAWRGEVEAGQVSR